MARGHALLVVIVSIRTTWTVPLQGLDILMRALIATVDILAAASIKVALAKDNWFCDTTDLGEYGLWFARVYDYDIILVDLMLPNVDGYQMLQRLRAARVHTPILILSARAELDERVKFLRFGADDFGSVMFEENVVSSAGTTFGIDARAIEGRIREAGFRAARRDVRYTWLTEPA